MKTNRPKLINRHGERATTGFTLLELLVVVAIIALLAALLLPTISKVKAHSRNTACKNHLSQIGRAMTMYVGDFTRYPPLFGKAGGPSSFETWADRMFPYYPLNWTNSSWHCPTYVGNRGVVEFQKPPDEGGKMVNRTSYAYNSLGIGMQNGRMDLGLGVFPRSTSGEQEVRVPSEMYTVADARAYYYTDLDGPAGKPSMVPWILPPGFIEREADAPHSQGYNVLFGDTHVSLVKRRDFLYPPRTAHSWNRDNQPHPEAWAPHNEWAIQN